MIEIDKKSMTEEQFRNMTKNIWGIRYKYDKKGDLIAYAHVGTLIADMFKKLKNFIKK